MASNEIGVYSEAISMEQQQGPSTEVQPSSHTSMTTQNDECSELSSVDGTPLLLISIFIKFEFLFYYLTIRIF